MTAGTTSNTRSWFVRGITVLVVVSLGAGLFGIGMVFSSSFGASEVATNARSLHWANATLGSAGIARASVAQSVFFAFDERLGVSIAEAKDAAIAEARRNIEPVRNLLENPDERAEPETLKDLASFVTTASSVIDMAATGDPDEAEGHRLSVLEPLFNRLSEDLSALQTLQASRIAESETFGGQISRMTQLAITFFIPAVAMVAFWWFVRRRMLARESELQLRLESERELGVAKDQFIAGLSHELRTPLTTIHGFSEILLNEERLDADCREMLNIINLGSSDLSRMVDDLLVAARIDADALNWKSELLDLSAQVAAVLAPYERAGDSFEVRVPAIQVYADPLHVRQILHNLISNAIRHGGSHILVSAKTSGTKAMLVVADDGPGVPVETEANLFTRYVHRGKTALIAGSVGLGLAVSRELAMRMGGSISYGRLDGWTTFTVTLPHYPKREGTEAPQRDLEDLVIA